MSTEQALRFAHVRSDGPDQTVRDEMWARAERQLAAGCPDCGKSWKLHFRRGDWKGCGK